MRTLSQAIIINLFEGQATMTNLIRIGKNRAIAVALIISFSFLAATPRVEASLVTTDVIYQAEYGSGDLAAVGRVLEKKVVSQRLADLGYTKTQINERLARLTVEERHQLATQIEALTPGGDALGAIVTILIIAILVVVLLKLVDKKIIIR